jgi:type III pantothenate kinase
MSDQPLLAITVGNTRTRFGLFRGSDLVEPVSMLNDDVDALVRAILRTAEGEHGVPMVIASVNHPLADRLETALEDSQPGDVYRVGRDLAVPVTHTLDDATTVGQDRLLCAFGAWSRAKQACVVIDAGTAITVDFIDGEGTFHGGVIAPGIRMMLASLHGGTAALPSLDFTTPDPDRGPFGKDTRHAMLLGVQCAAQGLVHLVIERYAEHYEAYPQIVATGGDAAALFENDPIIEHVVPDLQLVGVLETCRAELNAESGPNLGPAYGPADSTDSRDESEDD